MKTGIMFTKICEWYAFAAHGSVWPKDKKGWLEEENTTEQEMPEQRKTR